MRRSIGNKARTAAALLANFRRAHVPLRYWRLSLQLAREAISRRGAVQKPAELAPLIGILAVRRPARVLEIGTFGGGTLWAWCKIAADDATIVSVDLPGGPFGDGGYDAQVLRAFAGDRQTLRLIQGDSHAGGTREKVARALGGPIDFLFIDGDHSLDGVSRDFAMYSPLVRDGGLVALHDITPGPPEYVGGVPSFWRELDCLGKQEIVDELGLGGGFMEGGFGIGFLVWHRD